MATATGGGRADLRTRLVPIAAFVLLSIGVLVTAIAAYASAPVFGIHYFLRLLESVAIFGVFGLVLTRHIGLTLLLAVAPAAGILWSDAIAAHIGVPSVEPQLAFALASVPAFFYASAFEAAVLDGQNVRAATVTAFSLVWRAALGAIAIAFGLFAALVQDPWFRQVVAHALLQLGLSLGAALLVVPAGSLFLQFDEEFIARTNRVREWRVRMAYGFSLVAVPRWGLSVSGVGVVAGVLGYFGAETVLLRSGWIIPGLFAGTFLLSSVLFVRWRNALALGFALAVVSLIGFWSWSELVRTGLRDTIVLVEALALCFAVMLARTTHERLSGERDNAIARLRSIEEMTAPVLLVGTATIVAALLQVRDARMAAIILASGVASAILLVPAVTTALETIVPKRKSVSELYGRPSG